MSLLNPTMEKDQLIANSNIMDPETLCNKAENSIILNTWEENYQDLSGWCMETFQDRCIFPAGESKATKISGMKIEDKYMSIEKGGVEELVLRPNKILLNATEEMLGNYQQPVVSFSDKKILIGGAIDVPEPWMGIPQSSTALQIDQCIELVDKNELDQPIQLVTEIENKDSNHADQQGNWDVIKTFSNTDADDFDLLSYLCDDNMPSPENISTNSIDTSPVSTCINKIQNKSLRIKRRTNCRKYSKQSEKTTSSMISPLVLVDAEQQASSSRAPKRLPRHVITKINEKSIPTNCRRKRLYESDPDRSLDLNYRESREKNNEASRKSRINKKSKEIEMVSRSMKLEKDNHMLKMRVDELEKVVHSLRSAILESVLKQRV